MNTPKPQAYQNNNVPSYESLKQGNTSNSQKNQGNTATTLSQELSNVGKNVANQLVNETVGVLPNMLRSLLGQPLPMDIDPGKSSQRTNEAQYWKQRYHMAEAQRQQEKAIIEMKAQTQQMRVQEIKAQLQQRLTPAISRLAKEVENATFNAIASPDIYTENFFTQLLTFIVKFSARVNQASKWLAGHNARAQKKSPFFMKNKKQMQVDSYQSQERSSAFGG